MARQWWDERAHDRERRQARNHRMTIAALVVVLAVLLLQVVGIGKANDNINGFTLGLLLLAIVLGFAVVAPTAVKEMLDRVTTFKFGGVELGLQAAERLDHLQTQMAGPVDELNARDDVTPSERRPVGGGPLREYAAVQEKLQERLRFIRHSILSLKKKLEYVQIVEKIDALGLLGYLELQVIYDLLGRAEDGIEKLPEAELGRYLDRAWKFSTRLGTLVFERDVRKRMIRKGWFLLDFEQLRSHRPDFLAYKAGASEGMEDGKSGEDGDWLVIAARVEPKQTGATAERLKQQRLPFGAKPILVIPDSREDRIAENPRPVPQVAISALLEHPETRAF